jgi:hypothetical protein
MFCGAPLLFPESDDSAEKALVVLGMFEIAAALMTETEPDESPIRASSPELEEMRLSSVPRAAVSP